MIRFDPRISSICRALLARVGAAVWVLLLAVSVVRAEDTAKSASKDWFHWEALPDLPDPLGVAGPCVGVSNGALVVAAGSNFPVSKWEGGAKVFLDTIYVLESKAKAWKTAGKLLHAMDHGTAVSVGESMICLGGFNGEVCFDDVTKLTWNASEKILEQAKLPPLPQPCYDLSAAAIDGGLYVVAGQDREGLIKKFWRRTLKLNAGETWQELPAYPGPARFGAALIAQRSGDQEYLYLIGGKHGGTFLSDVCRFDPRERNSSKAWKQCAPMPRPALLAATAAFGPSNIFVFSGSSGAGLDRLDELREKYRFPRDVLAYDTGNDAWTPAGTMPEGLAAISAAQFDGGIAIPTGEICPGIRTPKCYVGRLRLKLPGSRD
jgi:solute:Na+ symporter, SSS family